MINKYLSGIVGLFLLFTSCLGDSSEMLELLSQPAVVDFEPERLIYVRNNEIIEPTGTVNLSGENGDCYLLSFRVDLGSKNIPEESSYTYYSAEIIGTPLAVVKNRVHNSLTDTTQLFSEAERTIGSIDKRNLTIQNQLFLYLNYSIGDSISIDYSYNMSYDPAQNPAMDETEEKVIYELYIRAEKNANPDVKTGDKTQVDPVAFTVSEFQRTFGQRQTYNDSIYFRVFYPKSFVGDPFYINWGESDIMRMPIE